MGENWAIARSHIVAIRKTTRQHHAVAVAETVQIRVFMPDFGDFLPHYVTEDVHHIIVAIGTGKNDNAKFHNSKTGLRTGLEEFRKK